MAKNDVNVNVNVKEKGSKKASRQVINNLNNIKGGADATTKSFLKMGTALKLAAAAAATFAAIKLVRFMKDSVSAASNLQESFSKFSVVFRDQIDIAQEWTKVLVESFAMSRREAYQYLSSIQDLLKPMGMASKAAGKMAFEVVKLTADLGSFNNLPTAKVMADVQSGLVGNYETMKKYGVILNATVVEQEALNMGLAKSKKTLTAAHKAQAAYSLMVKGSADAMGDMARTAGDYANTLKKFEARVEDLKAAIGDKLLPKLTEMFKEMIDFIELYKDDIVKGFGELIDAIILIGEKAFWAMGKIRDFYAIFHEMPEIAGEGISNIRRMIEEREKELDILEKIKALYADLIIPDELIDKTKKVREEIELLRKGLENLVAGRTLSGREAIKIVKEELDNHKKINEAIDERTDKQQLLNDLLKATRLAPGAYKHRAESQKLHDELNKLTQSRYEYTKEKLHEEYLENKEIVGMEITAWKIYGEKIKQLNEEVAAEKTATRNEELNADLEHINKILEAERKKSEEIGVLTMQDQMWKEAAWAADAEASKTSWQRIVDNAKGMADEFKNIWVDISNVMISEFSSGVTDVLMGTKSLKESFADMARSIIRYIIDMTVKMMIFRAIAGGFGFGGGGAGLSVAPGSGYTPSFAKGGVVTRPTLGLVGEGSQDEAVIPLEGGNVPVELRGGAGDVSIVNNINVNVTTNGGVNKEESYKMGNQIGKIVSIEIDKRLAHQMRPGGMLNRQGGSR